MGEGGAARPSPGVSMLNVRAALSRKGRGHRGDASLSFLFGVRLSGTVREEMIARLAERLIVPSPPCGRGRRRPSHKHEWVRVGRPAPSPDLSGSTSEQPSPARGEGTAATASLSFLFGVRLGGTVRDNRHARVKPAHDEGKTNPLQNARWASSRQIIWFCSSRASAESFGKNTERMVSSVQRRLCAPILREAMTRPSRRRSGTEIERKPSSAS